MCLFFFTFPPSLVSSPPPPPPQGREREEVPPPLPPAGRGDPGGRGDPRTVHQDEEDGAGGPGRQLRVPGHPPVSGRVLGARGGICQEEEEKEGQSQGRMRRRRKIEEEKENEEEQDEEEEEETIVALWCSKTPMCSSQTGTILKRNLRLLIRVLLHYVR